MLLIHLFTGICIHSHFHKLLHTNTPSQITHSQSLTHSLTCPLTHLLTHSLAHSLTAHSLAHSLTAHPLNPSHHRTNNSAILQLLLSLTGSLSVSGVKSLVTRCIATCPGLFTPYLVSVNLSFEPRPTSKWIENINFLTNVSVFIFSVDIAMLKFRKQCTF